MNIADQLANAIGRSDEAPNIALAEKIAKAGDKKAVKELIDLLDHKKSAVRNDVIKVIYEIAERKVDLVIPYTDAILQLLDHKDNRMIWGAMTALTAISSKKPEKMADHLPEILDAMDNGSVITRDHGIMILCAVAEIKKHHEDCMELLLEQLEKAPVNQVPMYAEKIAAVISKSFEKKFEKILLSRKDVLAMPAKQKRIEKLIKKLNSST
jgi:HEAT repeat protein